MRWCVIFGFLVSLVPSASAQLFPPCAEFTYLGGFDETLAAAPLGGGQGPEDVAFDPVSERIAVIHDVPGTTPDIFLLFERDGTLVSSAVLTPGIGGLCFMPNTGTLLVTYGNVIQEIDGTSGAPVPGGINVSVSGYGNIQDITNDPLVPTDYWIHNGNNGDVSSVSLTPGQTGVVAPTFQFLVPNPLSTPGSLGSQAMTFRGDNGNLLFAAAFFNNGTWLNSSLIEVTRAGSFHCAGASLLELRLSMNGDPCALPGAVFSTVNGMAWDSIRNELILSDFFVRGPTASFAAANIGRFSPSGSSSVSTHGFAGVRGDTLPFTLTVDGDATLGSGSFLVSVDHADPGDTLIFALSPTRACSNPSLSSNGSSLYVQVADPAFLYVLIPVATSSLTLNVSLATLPVVLAGTETYLQVAGSDLSGGGALITTQVARIRYELVP